MARRLKDLKELKIERPPRIKLSAKESLKRTKEFDRRRETLLPLLERARVEAYLPDLPRAAYYSPLDELTQEFTHTFRSCTTIHRLDGSYLSKADLYQGKEAP